MVAAARQELTLDEIAQQVRVLSKQTAQAMVRIGQHLRQASKRLDTPSFSNWLANELDWKPATAQHYIRIAHAFQDVDWTRATCEPEALKLLSHSAISTATTETAARILDRGIPLTRNIVKSILTPSEFQDAHRAYHEFRPARQIAPEQRSRPFIPQPAPPARVAASVLETSTLGRLVMALQVAISNDYGTPLRASTATALTNLQRAIQEQVQP
jgi:hypothetical protein